MNSTRAHVCLPFCGTETIRTAELHDFNGRRCQYTKKVGSVKSRMSDIALRVGIYSKSDRISRSMGSQRRTRFIVPKGLDLYCVMKLRFLIQHVKINLPVTSCYCPDKHISELTAMILQLTLLASKSEGSVVVVINFRGGIPVSWRGSSTRFVNRTPRRDIATTRMPVLLRRKRNQWWSWLWICEPSWLRNDEMRKYPENKPGCRRWIRRSMLLSSFDLAKKSNGWASAADGLSMTFAAITAKRIKRRMQRHPVSSHIAQERRIVLDM